VADALASLRRGEAGALDRLVALLYDDVRRVARERLRAERDGHTLSATALAHEAYLRLSTQRRLRPADRAEFFAAASNTMRRILVDYARTRGRQKRQAPAAPDAPAAGAAWLSARAMHEAIALDAALTRLASRSARAARVFELRAFGGLSLEEIASVLEVSTKTVQRDFDTARAWLRKEVGQATAGEAAGR
jgi:RNA polymerase sigma factor (TIGR02999 family)